MVNVCAIAKNEGLHIKEWIVFHQIVGVDHFVIYDNGSTDNTAEILSKFSCVEVIPWDQPKPVQLQAYQHYIEHHREPVWTAFLDCDEFLFSPLYETVPEALAMAVFNGVPQSAIGVSWVMFGAGGHETYSPEPVIERFTQHLAVSNPVNRHIKSVIWMDQEVKTGSDPHFFNVEHGTWNENGEHVDGPFSPHTSDTLRINHYHTKSREEWNRRIALGKPDRADDDQVADANAFYGYQAQDAESTDIQRFLPELKRRLGL